MPNFEKTTRINQHRLSMKYLLFLNILIINSLILSCSLFCQSNKPNIIVFMVDDLGWQDCSLPFFTEKTTWNKLYHTPNLEKLAAQGMKFTNAFGNQNCTPSRVSLMTGMNPINHGVNSWTLDKNISPEEVAFMHLRTPRWKMNGLSKDRTLENSVYATLLPELLVSGGYSTIHIGKAHFAAFSTPGSDPLTLGFQTNIGGFSAGQPASYYGLDSFGFRSNIKVKRAVPHLQEYWGKDIFLTDALTRKALSSLDSLRLLNKPFFLHFSHYAIHTPLQSDKKFVQKYYDQGLDTVEASYAALIEGMDHSLGVLMEYLDQKNLSDRTMIVFLSDNGGLSDVVRGGKRNFHNTPLRSGKTSGYDGGLRIPMVVRWPGVIKASSISTSNVMIEDVFTTIRSVAGVDHLPLIQKTDGLDLMPIFKKQTHIKNRTLTWHHPHLIAGRSSDVYPFSAIRINQWKLIYAHTTEHFELFNTDSDIGEKTNLILQEKQRAARMAKRLGRKLKAGFAYMPILKNTGKAIPYPDEVAIH